MHDQPCDHDHPAPATGGLGIQRAGELDAAAFEIAVADLLRACGRLHGFGGIARLVDAIGHRFTYQEWMTRDVADALLTHGQARGAACVVGAEPLCCCWERAAAAASGWCQAFAGCFNDDAQLRSEFMRAIGGR